VAGAAGAAGVAVAAAGVAVAAAGVAVAAAGVAVAAVAGAGKQSTLLFIFVMIISCRHVL
jgi:hypothetical protein